MYRNFYTCRNIACRWMWSRDQTCKSDMCPKCKTMNTATATTRYEGKEEDDFERRFKDREAKKQLSVFDTGRKKYNETLKNLSNTDDD